MKLKVVLAIACGPVVASAAILACNPVLAAQQRLRHHVTDTRPFRSVDDALNLEASAPDAAGIRRFSEDLIDLIVPEQAGDDYIESLSSRLATAEQMQKLIPETVIVQVFNHTMKKIGAPFKTDETTVRKFREHSIAVVSLPALLTSNRNGTYCSPTEAVYLLYLLFWANGDLPFSVLDNEAQLNRLIAQGMEPMRVMGVSAGPPEENASRMLSSYASRHRRQATTRLFNDIAIAFGF